VTAGFEDVPLFDEVVDLRAERYRVLDRKVDAAEGDGILARWEFGRELLAERVGKQLPNGRLDEVAAAIGKSRQEVGYRVRFAERIPSRGEVANAIGNLGSWYRIVNEFLGNGPHVSNNSGQNEWYTPPNLIEAARLAMGGIDLDPASSAIAQQTVQAASYYTAADDGLTRPWHGRVWLNPPYVHPLVGQFIDKLLSETASGRVQQATVLVNNATETTAGQTLLGAARAVCFIRGRVRYLTPDGDPANTPLQGQLVAYLTRPGGNSDSFRSQFEQLGVVL